MTINFGRIGLRRIISFHVTSDGEVLRSGFPAAEPFLIPAREHFRRWKIARKAWATRRKRQGQLRLL